MAGFPFPGNALEVVFSFDTTGSMSSILDEVKGRLNDMIQRLQADIPGIRLGVIAHGDYCDKDVFYLTRQQELTTDIATLCNFVNSTDGTGGGDPDECYELVLRKIRTEFDWSSSAQKIVVVIGDANPHEPEYDLNVDNIDWRQEIQELKKMGVKIYGVQAFENDDAEDFYRTLATVTDGSYLKLGSFSNICDFLMAICYRERGEEFLHEYETEVRSRMNKKNIDSEMEGMFGELRRSASTQSQSSLSKVPVLLSSGSNVSSIKAPSLVSSISNASVNKIPLLKPFNSSLASSVASRGIGSKAVLKAKLNTKKQVKKRNAKTLKTKVGDFKVKAKVKQASKTKSKLDTRNKTKSKGQKRVSKSTGQKSFREHVSAREFRFKNLKWSPWKLIYTSVKPQRYSPSSWSDKQNLTKIGWKNVRTFQEKTTKSAFYEFSVQTKPRGKKYVMFGKVIHAKNNRSNWEQALRGGTAKLMLGNLLRRNCKIFVRRAIVTKAKGDNIKPWKQYSYAWCFGRGKHNRLVKKNNVVLSEPLTTKRK